MRSPVALAASVVCLASAAVMAAGLAADDPRLGLDEAHQGDSVEVEGELGPWTQPGWTDVQAALWDTTYLLEIDDVEHVVLLTGMAAGLEHQSLRATAVVVAEFPHPEEPIDIIVLAPIDALR